MKDKAGVLRRGLVDGERKVSTSVSYSKRSWFSAYRKFGFVEDLVFLC